MSSYRVLLRPSALGEIESLPARVRQRIEEKVDALASNPRPPGSRKLEGGEGWFRVRVGDYRILYVVDDAAKVAIVVKVGHRGDVYRRR